MPQKDGGSAKENLMCCSTLFLKKNNFTTVEDQSNLIPQQHLGIRIELKEILPIAADQKYPLVMVVVRMGAAPQSVRRSDVRKPYRKL
jgi:hypothetical protein